MNVLDLVREQRPEVGPLDAHTRGAIRRRLVVEPIPPPLARPFDLDRPMVQPRRVWLGVAAAVLVAAGIVATVFVAGNQPEQPSAPLASNAPSTVPTFEVVPTTTAAPTTTTISSAALTAPLLVPGAGQAVQYTGSVMAGPPGSETVVLVAPDGSMQIIWLAPHGSGATSHDGSSDARTFGTTEFVVDDNGQVPLYMAESPCSLLKIADGGGSAGAWRPTMTELLGSMTAGGSQVSVVLPAGWEILAQAGRSRIYEVQLSTEAGAQLDVLQSPGSGAAFPSVLAGRQMRRVPFLGGDAWVGITSSDPDMTIVLWESGGTSYSVQTELTDIAQIESIIAGMTTIPASDWPTRYGQIGDDQDSLQLAPGCSQPILTITTNERGVVEADHGSVARRPDVRHDGRGTTPK